MFRLLRYELINPAPIVFLENRSEFLACNGNYNYYSTEAHKQSLGMCDQYDLPPNPTASLRVFCLCLCNGMVSGATIINFYF